MRLIVFLLPFKTLRKALAAKKGFVTTRRIRDVANGPRAD